MGQAAQLIVLESLTNPAVDRPDHSPLVAITMKATTAILGLDDMNKSGKRSVHLDVDDKEFSLKQALLPPRTYVSGSKVLKKQQVALDEGHLHSLLSSWESKDSISKMMIIANAMSQHPSIPFTVRFGENRASRLGRNPSQALRKIRNELTPLIALGPTMVTVELDKKGVLHLHGVVTTNTVWTSVKKVLQAIGGKSTSQAFTNRHQAVIKPPSSLCGWVAYMTKDLIDMPIPEREGFIYVSQSATQLGKAHLPVLNNLAHEKLDVISDWRGKASVYAIPGTPKMSRSVSGMTRH